MKCMSSMCGDGCPGGGSTVISCCDDPIADTLFLTTPDWLVTLTWDSVSGEYSGYHEESGDGEDTITGTFGDDCGLCNLGLVNGPVTITRWRRYVFACEGITVWAYVCLQGLSNIGYVTFLDKDVEGGAWVQVGEATGTFDCNTVSGSYTYTADGSSTILCENVATNKGTFAPHSTGDTFTLSD